MGAHGHNTYQGDMNDDPFDDRNQPRQKHKPTPIPLAAPRPGYAAQVTALNLSTPTSPSRAASPDGRSSPSHPRPLMLVESMNSPISPRMPSPGHNVPATPHPLPPTITPIQPVFARPSKNVDDRDVKFASQPILRGEKEETLLPRRGERGDDFWRRFSMVVHQEGTTQQKERYVDCARLFCMCLTLVQSMVEKDSKRLYTPHTLGLGHRSPFAHRKLFLTTRLFVANMTW